MEDQQLGWVNRPKAKQAFRVQNEPPHTVTILENGARAARHPSTASPDDSRRDMIFLGCSFTHGWGLNDEETFAWKVQAALPRWNVHNYGVNAYGTCQAYMLLKRLFEREKWRRPLVIYGFIGEHEQRNVADFLWHYNLSTLTSTGNVSLPACMLDESGSIVWTPARPYPQFPFRHTLAVIPIIEKVYQKFRGAGLAAQSQVITERLFIEMEAATKARSGEFGTLFFDNNQAGKSHYSRFLKDRGNRVIEIDRSNQSDPKAMTFFDGHPNARMTDLIAQSIVRFVHSVED